MKITIEVEDVTGKMYLRQPVADGETDDGTKIEVTSVIPDYSLHFKIGKKAYLVGMRVLLNAILNKVIKS